MLLFILTFCISGAIEVIKIVLIIFYLFISEPTEEMRMGLFIFKL